MRPLRPHATLRGPRSSRPESSGVVAAVGDPNPLMNGVGFERLRAAGVEVELACGEAEWLARVQNQDYRVWIAQKRPFVPLQGGGDAGRPGHRPGLALGHG